MSNNQRAASPRFMSAASAWSGIAVFLFGAIGFLILGFLKPGYDPLVNTISELGETGGVNAGVASALFILVGILEVVFGIGLFIGSKRSAAALVGTILLAVHGVFDSIGSGIFPCDAGGLYESFSGQMHFIVSVVGLVSLAPAPFFLWRSFVKEDRFAGGVTGILAVFAVLMGIGAVAFNVSFFTETLVGLTQRLIYYPYYIWIFLISLNELFGRRSGAAG